MVTPIDAQSALEYIHNHTHETGHILLFTGIKHWWWWWWWWW